VDRWEWTVLGFAMLLIAACSDSPNDADGAPNTPASQAAPATQPLDRVPGAASVEIEAIMADGAVTPEEYESAFFAVIACIEDAGFLAEGTVGANGSTELSVGAASEELVSAATEAEEVCLEEYFNPLLPMWAVTGAPDEVTVQEIRERFRLCLVNRGYGDVSSVVDELIGQASSQDVGECDELSSG